MDRMKGYLKKLEEKGELGLGGGLLGGGGGGASVNNLQVVEIMKQHEE